MKIKKYQQLINYDLERIEYDELHLCKNMQQKRETTSIFNT